MPFAPDAAPRDHLVTFYESDEGLTEDVASFLAEGFEAGDAAVVIATPDHRRSVEAALRRRSVPVDSLREAGRFVLADAAEMLASLMVGGTVDHGCFSIGVGGLVSRTAAPGRRVRAFGEMVGLLWQDDQAGAAERLEEHWNDLLRGSEASLFCAYPIDALGGGTDLAPLGAILRSHTHLCAGPRTMFSNPRRSR